MRNKKWSLVSKALLQSVAPQRLVEKIQRQMVGGFFASEQEGDEVTVLNQTWLLTSV